MCNQRVFAICLIVFAASASTVFSSASAQECFPFPWLCQQRPVQPGPPIEREVAPSYEPGYGRGYGGGYERGYDRRSSGVYGAVSGERFPVPAVPLSEVNPNFLRATVSYPSNEPVGTII